MDFNALLGTDNTARKNVEDYINQTVKQDPSKLMGEFFSGMKSENNDVSHYLAHIFLGC